MADINFKPDTAAALGRAKSAKEPSAPPPGDVDIHLIELLFFAYRDFVGDPDAVLERFGFGRAHHRVLHFVNRNPGIRVTDLLDILKITKQSLGRVLKQLVDSGFIEQRTGPSDRRQRLLYATRKGAELAARLSEPQARRIAAALATLDGDARHQIARFLTLMINEKDRTAVAALLAGEDAAAKDPPTK